MYFIISLSYKFILYWIRILHILNQVQVHIKTTNHSIGLILGTAMRITSGLMWMVNNTDGIVLFLYNHKETSQI
jgi:hypothetical protein